MKTFSTIFLLFTLFFGLIVDARVSVRGYYRKNGTYVSPHYRSSPDRSFSNNWSTKGNINPYTGKAGTKQYPSHSYSSSFESSPSTSNFSSVESASNSYSPPAETNEISTPAAVEETVDDVASVQNSGTQEPNIANEPALPIVDAKAESSIATAGESTSANKLNPDEISQTPTETASVQNELVTHAAENKTKIDELKLEIGSLKNEIDELKIEIELIKSKTH